MAEEVNNKSVQIDTANVTNADATLIEPNGWSKNYFEIFWKPIVLLFTTEEELNSNLEFLTTRAYLLATIVYGFFFVLFIEPLCDMLIESRPLRLKVLGYLYRPLEFMLERAFDGIFTIELSGDQREPIGSLAAIICNHQGFIDYPTMIMFCKKRGIENSSYFFVWKHCVRLPSVRVLYNMWRKQSNWRVPNISLAETFAPVLESPWMNEGGKSVIIFPEVTPWTASSMLADRNECDDQGCPKLTNLLYPRFNAFIQTMSFLRDFPLSEVYDITMFYTMNGEIGVPSVRQLLLKNQKWTVHMHVKKFLAPGLPRKEKHLVKWLEGQWYRKDTHATEMKARIVPVDTQQ